MSVSLSFQKSPVYLRFACHVSCQSTFITNCTVAATRNHHSRWLMLVGRKKLASYQTWGPEFVWKSRGLGKVFPFKLTHLQTSRFSPCIPGKCPIRRQVVLFLVMPVHTNMFPFWFWHMDFSLLWCGLLSLWGVITDGRGLRGWGVCDHICFCCLLSIRTVRFARMVRALTRECHKTFRK